MLISTFKKYSIRFYFLEVIENAHMSFRRTPESIPPSDMDTSFRWYDKSIFVVILFLFVFISTSNAQSAPTMSERDKPTTNLDSLFTTNNRLRFANYLFSDKDYLRAMNEYREYLKVEVNDTARFKFAECFYRMNRFEEASRNFMSLFYHSPFSEQARLGFYKSLFFENDFKGFREYVDEGNYMPQEYKKDITRLKFISYFFDDSVLPDTNKFFPAFNDSNKAAINKFYFMKKYPLKKNPTTAALLSAAVPGLGKIYTGQVGDGITAFIATGLLTFLSATNFSHDHQFRGWLFAGLAAFSYAGNIYGSAASAQIYNAGIKLSFDKEVKLYFEQRNYLLPKDDLLK